MIRLSRNPIRLAVFTLGLTATLSLVAGTAAAATFRVVPSTKDDPSDSAPKTKQSIQSAIDAATEGDTIIVDPGTYFENIRFNGKNITLRSTAPDDASVVATTIIDGNAADSVVTFDGTESSTCVLAGFTVRGGRASDGGGIFGGTSAGTMATIAYNVIENNVAEGIDGVSAGYGGGIFNCDGLVQNNTVRNNSALGNAASPSPLPGHGGGLYSCDGTVEHTVIHNNEAGYGGGLGSCNGTVQGNIIHTNTAQFYGGGLNACDNLVHDNMIHDNQAARGGGMATSIAAIENNTFYLNSAGEFGGALYECGETAVITNCIFAQNTALSAGPHLYNSNTPTYSLFQGDKVLKQTNITGDPLFVNAAARDLHIQPSSPCVDAGTSAVNSVLDFEWQTRPYDGTTEMRGDGSDYDIGADEYMPPQHQLTISVSGSGTTNPVPGTTLVTEGDSVSITAIPDSNWIFERWQGDFSGNANPLTFTMDGPHNVIATFASETMLVVSGNVKDAHTDNSLMNAQVRLFEIGNPTAVDSALTDSVGDFTLTAPNTYRSLRLTFSRSGYEPTERTGFLAPANFFVTMIPAVPAAPQGLVGRAGSDAVLLKWRPSPDYDVIGYNVYRAVSGTKAASLLNTSGLVRRPRYRDATATPAQTYDYYVTAVDDSGNESAASNTATITAGVIEVRVPDLVQAPNGTVRIPISVRNATGINPFGMDFNFTYPQNMVDLTLDNGSVVAGVSVEPTAITSRMRFIANTTEPGRVRISGIDTAGVDTLAGEGHLFDIVLTVRNDALGGACGALSFPDFLDQGVLRNGVTFYDDTPARIPADYTDTGLLCVFLPGKQDCLSCVQGDLNCDGIIDSGDVLLALQMAAGLVVPTECEIYTADFNGDEQIDSADALMIQRLSDGLAVNPGDGDATLADTLDPETPVSISLAQIIANPGDTAVVPISVDNAAGIAGAEFTIAYPPDLEPISVTATDVTAGFILEESFEPGVTHITMSAQSALAEGGSALATLALRVSETLPLNQSLPVTMADAVLKGQFGDSVDWYTTIEMSHGEILVVADADLNGDSAIDAVDVQLVINAALGIDSDTVNADVNNDGEANAIDVQLVINAALGIDR